VCLAAGQGHGVGSRQAGGVMRLPAWVVMRLPARVLGSNAGFAVLAVFGRCVSRQAGQGHGVGSRSAGRGRNAASGLGSVMRLPAWVVMRLPAWVVMWLPAWV
jgi:hypothetical protein